MYQLNSDSEGDEGSDINPEEDAEEERSESGEDHDSQHESMGVVADKGGVDRDGDTTGVGPAHRSSGLVGQSSPAPGASAARCHSLQDSAGVAGSATQEPIHTAGKAPESPHKQDGVPLPALGGFTAGQSLQAYSLSVAADATDSSAAEQDTLAYNTASDSMPCETAEQTLPYSAVGSSQLASPAAEQTLPYDCQEEGAAVCLAIGHAFTCMQHFAAPYCSVSIDCHNDREGLLSCGASV